MANTLVELARETSLSRETILEVLISPSSHEPEVVRYVMKMIRKTSYLDTFSPWKRPNQGSTIAYLTNSITDASSIEVMRGIDRIMSALGLTTSLVAIPTRGSTITREEILRNILPFNMISAVICHNLDVEEETIKKFERIKKPIVFMEVKKDKCVSVTIENQKGLSIGMNYLHSKGYRRIALMNGPSGGREPGSVPSERLIAYITALQNLGLPFDESLVYETPAYDPNSGSSAFEYFSSLSIMPDAIFCASGDLTALGFIDAAKEKGIFVPKDIAILGYDDLAVSALSTPRLTTIRQRFMIAGAGALVLALEAARYGPGESLVIMPELIERESV